jgi:hypothetical protein
MDSGVAVERILRWRIAQSEASAPPPPRATLLLALARPWWERWPERFRSRVERLAQMPLVYGFAMVTPGRDRRGHPVPVLLVQAEDREAYAHVLYFHVSDHDLRVRLELDFDAPHDDPSGDPDAAYEATFVDGSSEQPLLVGRAVQSQNGQYRVEVTLPEELAHRWSVLKATDRMPFRLILRPERDVG